MIFVFFIAGLMLASFINAQVYRSEKGFPLVEFFTKPSACENCQKPLSWLELVPVLGFIVNGGKCPKCKKGINYFYPLSELFLGVSLAVFYSTGASVVEFVSLLMLFVIASFDFNYKHFPKVVVHIFLVIGFLLSFTMMSQVYTGIKIVMVLFIVGSALLLGKYKKAFAFGDILVDVMIGFVTSVDTFVWTVLLSVISGGLFALGLVIVDKRWLRKHIPFVPFIYLGFFLAVALQSQLPSISFYDRLIDEVLFLMMY